jgi:filamentous hemagglutinin
MTGKIVTTSSGAVPSKIAPELQAYADKLGGLGVKTACGNTLGRCAEFRAANELILSNPSLRLKDIKFTPAVRPRTGEVVRRCENCTNIFGGE